MPGAPTVEELRSKASMNEPSDLQLLFHRLNNQLGLILAHAELLEAKAPDPAHRARASHIVSGVLDAMRTSREIHAAQNRLRQPDL
jgi:hypothetical protein